MSLCFDVQGSVAKSTPAGLSGFSTCGTGASDQFTSAFRWLGRSSGLLGRRGGLLHASDRVLLNSFPRKKLFQGGMQL
jgi:hypothetical protein